MEAGGGSEQIVFSDGGETGGWGPGGLAASTSDATPSTKGIKAGVALCISGGDMTIDAADDALHSNGSIAITAGGIVLASGDDAIHADDFITMDGGEVAVSRCYEGLESSAISFSGGIVRILSADDGVNIVGATAGGLSITGGFVSVDASGDGFDINGSIVMSGGTVLINGPTNDGNGALDYDRGFQITGGLLVAVGSAGMAMAPDATSTQNSLLVNLPAAEAAGTAIHIEASEGATLLTLVPTKTYRSVVISSPELQQGQTVSVHTGGTANGTITDGLLVDGTYSPGSLAAGLTLSGVTTSFSSGGGMRGGP